MLHQSFKLLYLCLGVLSLILGVIGIFIPLLPTTPFIILAAFLFSKSSKRMHDWLLSRPYLGDMILDWRDNKIIRPRAKVLATLAILLVFTSTVVFAPAPGWARGCVALLGFGLLWFILTRRSR